MLRNLEKNVIFRAIITKKILHKNKKKVDVKFYELFSFVFPCLQIFGSFSFYEPAILPIQQNYSAVQ